MLYLRERKNNARHITDKARQMAMSSLRKFGLGFIHVHTFRYENREILNIFFLTFAFNRSSLVGLWVQTRCFR